MPFRNALLYFALLITFKAGAIEYSYDYNAQCKKAYEYYMSLRFKEGNLTIQAELRERPGNLMAVYISNYADCMLLLFNGDPADLKKYQHHLDSRQHLLDNGDDNNPWFRLTKAGLYMHWAFIYIRMGENFKAATTFRKSYMLLKENKRRFPDFDYNNIFLGLEEAVAGTVPDDYKWIASIFGLKGNVKKGVAKIQNFITTHSQNDPLYYDAQIFNVYLRFYLMSQQEEVWKLINNETFPAKNNLLFSFVKANIALNYRRADEALRVLTQMQSYQGYNAIPAFDYEMGSAFTYKADNEAILYFKRFVSQYKGKLFVKDAYYKMACISYVNGDMKNAAAYRGKIQVNGSTDVDADRKAQRFTNLQEWPNPILLKVNWLIDGGYYRQAYSVLSAYKEADFKTVPEASEYNLRLGRIFDELGNDEKALQYYNRAIYLGKERKEYFAARASLQAAFIFEKKGDIKSALGYYNQCLDLPVQDYKNAIRQQAKAGVNRLGIN